MEKQTDIELHRLAETVKRDAIAEKCERKWDLFRSFEKVVSYLRYGYQPPRGRDDLTRRPW